MALGIAYSTIGGEVRRALEGMGDPIPEAITVAMRQAGDIIRRRGRDNIRSAGFGSRRWVDGLQVEVTPGNGFDASLRVFHRVGFAGIFEEGGTIQGSPLLWIPIEQNLPRSRSRWTPGGFVRRVGPLHSARGTSRPILVGKPPGINRSVPVFFGVRSVDIPKKFDIAGVVERVGNEFEQIYSSSLKVAS